jgi:peptidase E
MDTITRPQQIVAMGGGGFSVEPENLLLDRYVLGVAAVPQPKICFVGTASGDSHIYIDKFYALAKANSMPDTPPMMASRCISTVRC